ncbi:MAG: DNA-processing protein DprA [Oscillospiraceae bacterium]|nr:DNA-processing protein DprA [Oscillospiraceae bacterium]
MNDRDRLAVLSHFGNPEDIYFADSELYAAVPDMTKQIAESLQEKDLHEAGDILRECVDLGIHICTFNDGAYPARLKNIADPPMVLYYVGHLPDLDGTPVIAAVGTRKASPYGLNVAKRIGGQLARCGAIVVSGMAEGIDGAAAAGALTAGGAVVGVLGCGVDRVYPACNRGLFADVERHGCLMSEFPPGTEPFKWNFPRRNRILSGLSNGVLVIEAPQRSGALITARQAADQGRDVFVVPGNVDVATCVGSNALMREGAIPVRNGWDVVSEYLNLYPDKIRTDKSFVQPAGFTGEEKPELKVAQNPKKPRKTAETDENTRKDGIDKQQTQPYYDIQETFEALPENQRKIAQLLLGGELLVDDVIAQSQMPTGEVLSQLTLMEIQGVVVRKPGKRVALK